MIIIVMGVTGSGKSTIGALLARKLGVPFLDADDFHPKANIDKMASGQPLNDQDRLPWLEILSEILRESVQKKGAVLGCSALKDSYRKILSSKINGEVSWVFLNGSKELIMERLSKRKGHFMPEKLLDSQFEALEAPSNALIIDIAPDSETITGQIIGALDLD